MIGVETRIWLWLLLLDMRCKEIAANRKESFP
jgi:hypothetical protein